MLSPQEYREQADQCIGWARSAVSDSERKLYRQLAVFWLEKTPFDWSPAQSSCRATPTR